MHRVRLIGSIGLLTVCLVAAGCGGSDDSSSTADPAAATGDGDATTDADAASSDAESESSESESESAEVVAAEVPELSDGGWEGTVHFEISGEVDASADLQGGAFTQGGVTIMSFADDAADGGAILSSSQISLSNDPAQESVVFVSADEVSAGGTVGKECSVSITTNSDTAAAGDFSCEGASGVSMVRAEEYTVNIRGSFTLEKG